MEQHFKVIIGITNLLENRFNFLGFKFGLEPIISLIPGLGDAIGFLLSLYMIWMGRQMRIPDKEISRMVSNIVFDFFIGIIPVVGDLGDFVFKANSRNLKILMKYRDQIIEGKLAAL